MVEQLAKQNEEFLESAQRAATVAAMEASEAVLTYWPSPTNPSYDSAKTLTIVNKADGIGNFHTPADIASGEVIREVFTRYPLLTGVKVLSEEWAPDSSEYTGPWWNVDEVDGTANFSRGSEHYGVSIGLHAADNTPEVGVIAFPARRELILARRGLHAMLMRFKDGTSGGDLVSLTDLTEHAAQFPVDLSDDKLFVAYDLGYSNKAQQIKDGAIRVADRVSALKSYHSSSYTLGELVLGRLDAFFTKQPTIYDIGASSVGIEAIGGKVSDMDGNPIDWTASERSFLAARTPQIHDRVLELLHAA